MKRYQNYQKKVILMMMIEDLILAKVKAGKWIIEHYYDVDEDREDGIYTRLYIK
jgi:hypothetical protein